jgi:molybdopterin-guanine dinucleotide biosynthesis protein B
MNIMKISKKKTSTPFVSVVGNSGSGKTTFIEKLIPELIGRGLKVGTIKHDVHGFEMDKPGKDSWRHNI